MDSDRIAIAEQRIAADQWDIDAWQILPAEVEKSSFSDAKPLYERLVAHFPPIGKFWKSYAEHLIREDADKHDDIRTIYERAVKSAPTSVDLWLSYVSFASSLAVKVPGSKWESDAITVYERALAVAGLDLNAHPLWSHYIDFLKSHSTQSDSHRREALRRVFQRAVMIFHLAHLPFILATSLYVPNEHPCIRALPIPSIFSISMKKEHLLGRGWSPQVFCSLPESSTKTLVLPLCSFVDCSVPLSNVLVLFFELTFGTFADLRGDVYARMPELWYNISLLS